MHAYQFAFAEQGLDDFRAALRQHIQLIALLALHAGVIYAYIKDTKQRQCHRACIARASVLRIADSEPFLAQFVLLPMYEPDMTS